MDCFTAQDKLEKRQASGFKSVYSVEVPNLIGKNVQPIQTRTPVFLWRMCAPEGIERKNQVVSSPTDSQMEKEKTKGKCNKVESKEEMKDDRSEQHRNGKQMHNEPVSDRQTKK